MYNIYMLYHQKTFARQQNTLTFICVRSVVQFNCICIKFSSNICNHLLVTLCTVFCLSSTSSSLLPFNYSPLSFWQIRIDTIRVCTLYFITRFISLCLLCVFLFWWCFCCFCRCCFSCGC